VFRCCVIKAIKGFLLVIYSCACVSGFIFIGLNGVLRDGRYYPVVVLVVWMVVWLLFFLFYFCLFFLY